MSPQLRAVIAVGAATAGIAIALLIGIAPLIWTVTALVLLTGALILAAGLDLSAATASKVPTFKVTTDPGVEADSKVEAA